MSEIDRSRLSERCAGLNVTFIDDTVLRTPVRVGGEIKRVVTAPARGHANVEVTVDDGHGTVTAIFTGRRSIPGLTNGRTVVFEGVIMRQHGRPVIFNPAYTLIP